MRYLFVFLLVGVMVSCGNDATKEANGNTDKKKTETAKQPNCDESVDDIATDFGKAINSSTELISHYKKYEPIYKYQYKDTPKKLKNYESYLKSLESGTVTDLTMLVKGKPLFVHFPEGINTVALKIYLNELPEEEAKKRIKTIQSLYRDFFKGKNMEVLDTSDEIGSSVGKGDEDGNKIKCE